MLLAHLEECLLDFKLPAELILLNRDNGEEHQHMIQASKQSEDMELSTWWNFC